MTHNHLDLRRKPVARIIERVTFRRRPWHVELVKVILGAIVATGAVYAVSKADESMPRKSFSAIGAISALASDGLSLEGANGSDGGRGVPYSFSLAESSKAETSEYLPVALSNLRVGDRVIVQGLDSSGALSATRIITFSPVSSVEAVVDTATSTDASVATSTATGTDTSSATSTDASVATSTPTSTPDALPASGAVAPSEPVVAPEAEASATPPEVAEPAE